ncbi:MAG: phosphoribosylanthranilate isomerase [Saprospiraceae bacterium]|nr:phosphoribosylanthranilate isomerase [Saprospiraceae bacterium]
MKIKICGMREPENIKSLLELPIDYIGFIFYPPSPRYIEKESGLSDWIRENEEAFATVKKVGVFVNAEIEELLNKVHDFQLDYVQLHGEEQPQYCQAINRLWRMGSMKSALLMKAFSIGEGFKFESTLDYEPHCAHFLFDTKGDKPGGTGASFDWNLLNNYEGKTSFLLSGGIGPDSLHELLHFDHPQWIGIDLNSRFETSPGEKDIGKISAFIDELQKRKDQLP